MLLTEESSFDPSKRRLCPDGTCTGVLDDGGWCTECRKTWINAAPPVDAVEPGMAEENAVEPAAADMPESVEGFNEHRTLCPDGACTGVIEPDGRCSVCRRAATDTAGV